MWSWSFGADNETADPYQRAEDVISVPDNGGDGETKELVVRVKVIETKLKGVMKSLRKECCAIRLRKRDLYDVDVDLRDKVLEFLDNARLLEVVTKYIEKDEIEDGEALFAQRHLMCALMFKNAQRQGAVVNLRLCEVQRSGKSNNTHILYTAANPAGQSAFSRSPVREEQQHTLIHRSKPCQPDQEETHVYSNCYNDRLTSPQDAILYTRA